jgi:hypothetical protein
MRDAIVIGNGIVGASIAGQFRLQGRETLVLDNYSPFAGTNPCGGSVKPSPLAGLAREEEKATLETLNTLWGLTRETYHIKPSGKVLDKRVYQIGMDLVHKAAHEKVDDAWIENRLGFPIVHYTQLGVEKSEQCRLLVVAAGMSTPLLIPEIEVYGKFGVSFRFRGQVEHPFVQAWAPYKQITVHNYGPHEMWAADGSTLKPENWTSERTDACMARVQAAIGTTKHPTAIREGIRSFAVGDAKPCLVKQVNERVWVAVGAGKFGCLAAGWAANRMARVTDWSDNAE